MKKSIKTVAATVLLAAGLFAAAPAVANASTIYTPVAQGGTVTIAPAGSATFNFTGFQPGETVIFTCNGEHASAATLAIIRFAVVESVDLGSKPANASGDVSVTVTFPSDASGSYTVTARGTASGASATAGAAISTSSSSSSDASGDGLAVTGVDGTTLLGFWIGGGVLVLAGASIAVASSVRRQRQQQHNA